MLLPNLNTMEPNSDFYPHVRVTLTCKEIVDETGVRYQAYDKIWALVERPVPPPGFFHVFTTHTYIPLKGRRNIMKNRMSGLEYQQFMAGKGPKGIHSGKPDGQFDL